MAKTSWSTTTEKSTSTTTQSGKQTQKGTSQEKSSSVSTQKALLDEQLLQTILSGLYGPMTEEEVRTYAESLMKPQLSAGLEASEQAYETTKLAKEQEIENLAAQLARSIEEQDSAYKKNIADIETAALARGMGRSSYTLDTMANQGNRLMEAVRQLTDETTRQTAQIQDQISQAARQDAQTQGRLQTDYAAQLSAKIQELMQQQKDDYNRDYLSAISAAMGKQTTGTSESQSESESLGTTESTSRTDASSTSTTTSGSSGGSGGGGGGSKTTKTTTTTGSGSLAHPGAVKLLIH